MWVKWTNTFVSIKKTHFISWSGEKMRGIFSKYLFFKDLHKDILLEYY